MRQDFLYGLTIVKETTIEPLQETPSMLEELQVVTISVLRNAGGRMCWRCQKKIWEVSMDVLSRQTVGTVDKCNNMLHDMVRCC